jgi:hypothetical protein
MASEIKEDLSNFILPIWLFISPWALQFAPSASGDAAFSVAAWNAWISAVVVGVIAVMGLYRLQQWEEWVSALVGFWIAVSPWAFGFSKLIVASWNAVFVGALVLCLAAWDLYEIHTRPPESAT